MAHIFDGKAHSTIIREQLAAAFGSLKNIPTLVFVVVGDDPVTARFVRMKEDFAHAIGVPTQRVNFERTVTTSALTKCIAEISLQTHVGGCVVQLPLPEHVDTKKVLNTIPTRIDVDVLSGEAYRLFEHGELPIMPPVAAAITYALDTMNGFEHTDTITVVGKGRLVGLPTYQALYQRGYNVMVFDDMSDPDEMYHRIAQSKVVITGVGVCGLIKPDHVQGGVILVDAGTSELAGKLCGDIDPLCYQKAQWYTPVPGGIGPTTVAMIFQNLYDLYHDNESQ